jgi:hypothetical protein
VNDERLVEIRLSRNTRRWLTRLAEHLREPWVRRHFDLGSWLKAPGSEDPAHLLEERMKEGAGECGATACAIGWLPILFPRSFGALPGGSTFDGSYASVYRRGQGGQRGQRVDRDANTLGLGWDLFSWLFMPSAYPSDVGTQPTTVARRIEYVLACSALGREVKISRSILPTEGPKVVAAWRAS